MEIMQPNIHSNNINSKRYSYIKPPIPPKPKIIPKPKKLPPDLKPFLTPKINVDHKISLKFNHVNVKNYCPTTPKNSEDLTNGFSCYSVDTDDNAADTAVPKASIWFTKSYHNDIRSPTQSDECDDVDRPMSPTEDVSSTIMELTLEDCVELCSKSSSGSNISLAGSEGDVCPHSKENGLSVPSSSKDRARYSVNFGSGSFNSEDSDEVSHQEGPNDRTVKAFRVATEIKTSEESFIEILTLLNEKLMTFLREKDCIDTEIPNSKFRYGSIPESFLNEIFKFLPHLQSLNQEILTDFQNRIDNWESHPKIADIIIKKGPFLKLYANYIKELESHSNLLEECATRFPYFGQCLREFESSEVCKSIPIVKHMLTPMQRITKYKELMRQYLKYLSEDGVDYADAEAALTIVQGVAEHANEAIREFENAARLLCLQERLNGIAGEVPGAGSGRGGNPHYLLVEPGRRLLKEGQLMKLCRRDVRVVYLILLSDCLLYTTQDLHGGRNCSLKLRYKLPLEGMRVDIPVSEDFQTEFSVISTSRSFTVRARSTKERDNWLSSIRTAIENNASRRCSFQKAKTAQYETISVNALGKQAPAWIPDNRVTMCQLCTSEFSLTFRRHHCRACGKVVCRYCSANRAPLEYMDNQPERVCDHCFEELQKVLEDQNKTTDEGKQDDYLAIKGKFKRGVRDYTTRKSRFKKPERLMEVPAGDQSSQICGYLRQYNRRNWRQSWFVLKDKVLYEYRAPEDVCALSSLPILGYAVSSEFQNVDIFDGVDESNAFQLLHSNQPPLVFSADSADLADKWRSIMEREVVL